MEENSSMPNLLKTHLLVAFAALLIWPTSAQADLVREVEGGRLNWTQGILTVTGTGSFQPGLPAGQSRLMAQRAALADGYRQLAAATQGVQVFSETTVRNFVVESELVRLQVSAVLKGAKQTGQTRYFSDGTVEVDVALPVFGRGSLAQAVQLGQLMQAELQRPYSSLDKYLAFRGVYLAPAPPRLKPERGLRLAHQAQYTGLIIDATGLAADPAMGPFIVGAGTRVHPHYKMVVDPELIVKQGPLHYVEELELATADSERIGDNPLIIQAKAAIGHPVRSNILLDDNTALKVLDLNQHAGFLEQFRVILVL